MNNTSQIRLKTVRYPSCWSQIETIRRTVFIVEQGIPESLEWDEFERCSWHSLAHCNDDPAGTGRLQPDGKITRIAVLKHWRGHGVASEIIEHLLKIASSNDIRSLYLNAQTTAAALYERFGFTIEGDVFDEGGIEHIRMVRQ